MKELPLAVRQSIWIHRIGYKYYGKCKKCKAGIDCFNIYVAWDGDIVDFDKLAPICRVCYLLV